MDKSSSFDVFLSHRSQDKPTVEALARRLEDDEGLRPWLDKWNLIPGEPWAESIEHALQASSTCAVFLGPGGIGPWENEEMRAALSFRVEDNNFRVIPVLLPGAGLPERRMLPPFLSRLTWVDFRSGLDNQLEFRRLVAGIRGIAPGRDLYIGPTPDNPYRGLEVFEEIHERFFFGREATKQHVVEALSRTSFMAILGASGSGKSSLVRAGVIPQLKSGKLPGSEDWTYITLTPGVHPLNELALALVNVDSSDKTLQGTRTLISNLESDERSLHLQIRLALSHKPKNARVFIFIDQFEEILTLCHDERERDQFLKTLRYASTFTDSRTIILITIRADFMGRVATKRNVAELLSAQQFVISPMDDEELRSVIEGPAQLVGLKFEDGLVDQILQDLGHQPGELPLLETALTQLYEHQTPDHVATLSAYREIGGVKGAIAQRANEVYEKLSAEEKVAAKSILLRLTQPGEGVEDTRIRAELRELLPDSPQRDLVEGVIEKLAAGRLLTISRDESGVETVDVAHEVLIRGWPQLKTWIDEARQDLIVHRRLSYASRRWVDRDRDPDLLYRGFSLDEVLKLKRTNNELMNRLETEFLETSRKVQQTKKWTRRFSRGVILTILAAGVILALVAQRSCQEQKAARVRELITRVAQLKSVNPDLALALGLEAERISRTEKAGSDLRSQVESSLRYALSGISPSLVLRGHAGIVWYVDFSPDGKYLVTGSADSTARIWNTETGALLHELRGHTKEISFVKFSPDGNKVLTASSDSTAIIWDAHTGKSLHLLAGHHGEIWSADISANGKYVVTASHDNRARIWDAETGASLHLLEGHSDLITRTVFSPDSKYVATVSGSEGVNATGDNTARIWDVQSGNKLAVMSGHAQGVTRIAFSPDSKRMVTASDDKTARVWEVTSGKELAVLPHSAGVNSVAFSPSGNYLVTGCKDATVRIWIATTGKEVALLLGQAGSIYSVKFSPGETRLITTGADNVVRLWDAQKGRVVSTLRGHSGEVWYAAFSHQRAEIATASFDGTARVWQSNTGQPMFMMSGHKEQIWSVGFSPDGNYIVTGSTDKTVRIWDAYSGVQLKVIQAHDGQVRSAVFSPSGKLLVTAGFDNRARIWDLNTGQVLRDLSAHSQVWSAAFSPDGKLVVTGGKDNLGRVWNAETGQQLSVLTGHQNIIRSVSFSPDRKRIVTASHDYTARVWDAQSGSQLLVLSGHGGEVWSAAFSPDGQFIVSGSRDKTARLWDAHTGQMLLEFRGHNATVGSVAFSPDGKLVLTGSRDASVRIWDTQTGQQLSELYGHDDFVRAVAFSPDGKRVVSAGTDMTASVFECEVCGNLDELIRIANLRNPRSLTAGERRLYLHEN